MELHLEIAGYLQVLLALIHFIFPKYFKWKEECSSLSLINKQMMYIHTAFIAIMVFLIGVLCLTSSKEIIESLLGKRIALGIGIFWFLRLLTQLFGYSPKLWKGKRFETSIHVIFIILWAYLSWMFVWIYAM